MTVQTNTNVASFNGNGVTQIFPIAFKFNNDTDLVVLLADDATGVSSLLTLNSDYTVSGEGDEEGGLINVVVAPAVGKRLFVSRVVDILQMTDLRNQGKFFAEVHEDAFDLLTMIAQQHQSDIARTLRVAETDPVPLRIPAAAQRAGKLLSFDHDGNPSVAAPVVDSSTQLRIDLATSAGSGLVGHKQSRLSSAIAETVQSALDTIISVHTSGAVGDGATDDTAAINALIRDVAVLGGGEIRFSPGRTYFIAGTILLPSNVKLNLCGATLKGAGATVGTMFRSAFLTGGEVVSNIGSAPETQLVRHASVSGGIIADVGLGFDLYNFVMGCSLKQLVFQNCRQAWKMERCFYPTLEDIWASGVSDPAYPTYHFKNQANAIVLTRVSTVAEFGYFIEGGCTAFTVNGGTFEGGAKGFKFTGDCLGMSFQGGYFEAVPGTLFDFSEAGTCAVSFKGNYINYVDTIFDDGGSTTGGPAIYGEWDSSNFIANINGVSAGVTYRARMLVSGLSNYIHFAVQANREATQAIPANWTIGKSTNIEQVSSVSATSAADFRQKSIYSGLAIIPMRRGGDVGPAYSGSVFYSTVTSASGSVTIDTKINYRPNSLFAKFQFAVQDGNGVNQVYGDIYGANVDKRGSTPVTVTAADNGGMLRLVLGITGDLVSITGSVQICS
ncbi:hypothetical protein RT21_20235 [Pseudomonas sp. 10B238]|uniref:glycosyl hydrolase family 28-related protein n=1 Tax=Pseudomonas sp. 10B238 TaxID=1586417 RepID=UPI000617E2D6|nr:glycosyl hydrolase family 28-related protein [Pseudomonas sp. 10B238]KJJ61563.1 hypothetical protein RT21_20235 [Pseudomonas sp. 10B238]